MPLRSFLKINGVNGDATADAFDASFTVGDIGAQTPSGTPQTFSFDAKDLKTSAAVSSSDIVLSDIAPNDSASSAIASSAGLSAVSAAVLVPASSPLHYFLKIDGVNGDSTVKGFEGWFSIDDAIIGNPETFAFDLSENRIDAAVSSDVASQINQMAMGLASFMASSQLGASSSQDLVFTQSTQQDNRLPTVAAPHA